MNFGDKIHTLVPCPLALFIYVEDPDDYFIFGLSFAELIEEHNGGKETQINHNTTGYIVMHREADSPYSGNYFKFLIGKEVVLTGSFDETNDMEELFKSCMKTILEQFHDKIYRQQCENQKILEKLEYEGKYNLLYEYSKVHDEDRALFFLKKCAAHYKFYEKKLLQYYKGRYGKRYENIALSKKMMREKKPDYYCF